MRDYVNTRAVLSPGLKGLKIWRLCHRPPPITKFTLLHTPLSFFFHIFSVPLEQKFCTRVAFPFRNDIAVFGQSRLFGYFSSVQLVCVWIHKFHTFYYVCGFFFSSCVCVWERECLSVCVQVSVFGWFITLCWQVRHSASWWNFPQNADLGPALHWKWCVWPATWSEICLGLSNVDMSVKVQKICSWEQWNQSSILSNMMYVSCLFDGNMCPVFTDCVCMFNKTLSRKYSCRFLHSCVKRQRQKTHVKRVNISLHI